MFTFLLVVHAIISASLVGVILIQRSEGGGLAGGGSPGGLVSARGAADFLTRTTAILAGAFILLSIGLAAMATVNKPRTELDTSLQRGAPAAPAAPAPAVPMLGAQPGAPATSGTAVPAPVQLQPAPEKVEAAPAIAAQKVKEVKPAEKAKAPAVIQVPAPKAAAPAPLPKVEAPAAAPAPAEPKGE